MMPKQRQLGLVGLAACLVVIASVYDTHILRNGKHLMGGVAGALELEELPVSGGVGTYPVPENVGGLGTYPGAEVGVKGLKTARDFGVVEGSGSVLSALEQSMDQSIDDKVTAYLSVPQIASMPLVSLPVRPGDVDADAVEKSQIDFLTQKQRMLAKRRDELLGQLRARRDRAAEIVAKGMVDRERGFLHRAVLVAQQRIADDAQKWGRISAQKMHEADLEERYAKHVGQEVQERNDLMDSMLQ